MVRRPPLTQGMHHVAIFVHQLEACVEFYTKLLGLRVEWQPDEDNYYLTSGTENVALHRRAESTLSGVQRLDHIGFIVQKPEWVDEWHTYLKHHDVTVQAAPKTHRDGARSFYCLDPDGTSVQLIYHPPISHSPD